MKLSYEEKRQIREALQSMCAGTELHHHDQFLSQYIGAYVVSLVENCETVFKRNEQCARCGAENPEFEGYHETIESYPLCGKCKPKG